MRLACRIAEKAYLAQQKVVVLLDDGESLRRFDELLWTFGDGSFVPHDSVSADGANVYVAGLDTVVTFSRNAGTGELTFVEFEHQSVGGVDGLSNATDVAVSPDDGHVYVTGALDGTVAVFDRDPGTGALSFVEVERNGVGGVDGLGSAETIRLSPDGTDVYVAGPGDDAVAVFRRDPGTGALTFTEVQRDGPSGAEGLESARGLAFDPTGTHLYVGATHDAVVFSRTAATGALAFVDAVPDGLATLGAIAISPDGAHVYVTTGVAPFPYEQNGVAVLGRDAGTGLLAFIDVERDGVNGVQGLAGPRGVTVSPDGAHVYVVGDGSPAGGAIAAFSRNAGTGELTFVETESDGVGGVDGLGGAEGITVSPDGAHVYVASTVDDAVAVFGRNAGTGALTFVEAQFDGVGGVEGLGGAISVAVSPDGARLRLRPPGLRGGRLQPQRLNRRPHVRRGTARTHAGDRWPRRRQAGGGQPRRRQRVCGGRLRR